MRNRELTSTAGRPIEDNQRSLSAGPWGPIVFEDHRLFENMAHFNRERSQDMTGTMRWDKEGKPPARFGPSGVVSPGAWSRLKTISFSGGLLALDLGPSKNGRQ